MKLTADDRKKLKQAAKESGLSVSLLSTILAALRGEKPPPKQ